MPLLALGMQRYCLKLESTVKISEDY
jgi:hypothetical protein